MSLSDYPLEALCGLAEQGASQVSRKQAKSGKQEIDHNGGESQCQSPKDPKAPGGEREAPDGPPRRSRSAVTADRRGC